MHALVARAIRRAAQGLDGNPRQAARARTSPPARTLWHTHHRAGAARRQLCPSPQNASTAAAAGTAGCGGLGPAGRRARRAVGTLMMTH